MLQLVTDSSADLPRHILDKYNISVVPMNIRLEGKDYKEGVDISSEEFLQRMFNSRELPKTSQPSPSVFMDKFNELSEKGEVLCLTISSELSGTYESACIGKEMSGKKVTVFDSLSGSLGHGLLLIKAATLAAKGFSVENIVSSLSQSRKSMNILILLNTLENIVKGGRLSKFQGSIAKILDIRALLHNVEGKVEMLEKLRGKKKVFERLIEIIGERKKDFSDTVIGITHADNFEDAEALKRELLERYCPRDVLINYMGATMGTYAGRGGMIISFFLNKTLIF